jgi:hypothetical protein
MINIHLPIYKICIENCEILGYEPSRIRRIPHTNQVSNLSQYRGQTYWKLSLLMKENRTERRILHAHTCTEAFFYLYYVLLM